MGGALWNPGCVLLGRQSGLSTMSGFKKGCALENPGCVLLGRQCLAIKPFSFCFIYDEFIDFCIIYDEIIDLYFICGEIIDCWTLAWGVVCKIVRRS